MAGMKYRVAVCAAVLEQDDKFAVYIYHDGGAAITQSDFRFSTKDEAAKAGAEILDYGVYEMKKYAAEVFGGGNETSQDPAPDS